MPPTDKLTILFLAANPLDTQQLQLDEEVRAIDKALRETQYRDRFELRSHWALQYGDLPALLLRYNPHIVHFSGHGSPSGELVFSDGAGKSHLAPPTMLADLFSLLRDNIRCVVLNACYSEDQAQGIAESIDCVVGMTRAVDDDAAVKFAAGFYLGLGYGRSIATAFGLGRNNMGAHLIGEETAPRLLDPHNKAASVVFVDDSIRFTAGAATVTTGAVPPLRELKGKQLQAAMNALLAVYDEAGLTQMVKFGLNENLATIVGGSTLRDKVFNLLEWARMRGRLAELLQAALDDRPDSLELREFIASLS